MRKKSRNVLPHWFVYVKYTLMHWKKQSEKKKKTEKENNHYCKELCTRFPPKCTHICESKLYSLMYESSRQKEDF